MPDSATITYELPVDELARLAWRRMVTRPAYLKSIGFFGLLGLVCVAVGGELTYAGLLFLIYALLRPAVSRQVISRAVRGNLTLQGPRTVEFSRAGITASGAEWSSRVPWRHFKAWSEDESFFYLEVTASGFASVIPKSAMNEDQQLLLRACLAPVPPAGRK
jgi:hypothetical protein